MKKPTNIFSMIQKQPSKGAPRKRCSENMQQIYKRTPKLKYDFNKVAKHLYWNRTLAWMFSCIFSEHFFLRTILEGCYKCLKILLLVLTYLKMCGSFKNDQFLIQKTKKPTWILPCFNGTTFSTKFVLDAKVQNSASWNISNLDLCGNSVALNRI